MVYERIKLSSFSVIGKLGSTDDGKGFIKNLWKDADMYFIQVREFAKKDDNGYLKGMWGLMSDFSMSFKPWEDNFTKGYYLAGVECIDESFDVPAGWTRWDVPSQTYLKVNNNDASFNEVIAYLKDSDIELVGAVFDFTDPNTHNNYMLYPIERE